MSAKAGTGSWRSRCRRGLSLIELMINLSIVSLLAAAITAGLVAMAQSFRGNEALLRSRQSATVALDYMLTYVRQAKQINFPTNPTSATEMTATQVTLLDHYDRLQAKNNSWRTFSYDAASKTLQLSINGGTARVVLTNVTSLRFRSIPELDTLTNTYALRSVTIEMTLSTADAAGKPLVLTFGGTAYARSIPLA